MSYMGKKKHTCQNHSQQAHTLPIFHNWTASDSRSAFWDTDPPQTHKHPRTHTHTQSHVILQIFPHRKWNPLNQNQAFNRSLWQALFFIYT